MTKSDLTYSIHGLKAATIGDDPARPATLNNIRHLVDSLDAPGVVGIYFYIDLPDGRWMAHIYRHGDNYCLWLPETREQEAALLAALE